MQESGTDIARELKLIRCALQELVQVASDMVLVREGKNPIVEKVRARLGPEGFRVNEFEGGIEIVDGQSYSEFVSLSALNFCDCVDAAVQKLVARPERKVRYL